MARYICSGIENSFRVGFKRGSPLRPAQSNLESASAHPEAVNEFIWKELSLVRLLGPFPMTSDLSSFQVNRIGVVPKGHGMGKWRLITNLSFPHGASVNDGINPLFCSLCYTTVDEMAAMVARLGRGTMLAKIDIELAYRLLSVHPQDRILHAIRWDGQLYIDAVLPYGLRSAAKIFNAVADALNWHVKRAGVEFIEHYLDDYIIVGSPGTSQCQDSLTIVDRECKALGVPQAAYKQEGLATCITFLRILVDTEAGRLPMENLHCIRDLLQTWGDRKSSTKKELESLVGNLSHVVRSGRSFSQCMLDLLHAVNLPSHSSARI